MPGLERCDQEGNCVVRDMRDCRRVGGTGNVANQPERKAYQGYGEAALPLPGVLCQVHEAEGCGGDENSREHSGRTDNDRLNKAAEQQFLYGRAQSHAEDGDCG